MAFLRVVEVIPPLFSSSQSPGDGIDPQGELDKFVSGVGVIRDLTDLLLLANVKSPDYIRFDPGHAAVLVKERMGIPVAPVVVCRGQDRAQFLSSIATLMSLGVDAVMLAWGDRQPPSGGASNVRGFSSLADAVREADLLRRRSGAGCRILAPVDVESLATLRGVEVAAGRVRAGADLLLAQPPTTDPLDTFERHVSLIDGAGLGGRVLLNAFPFLGGEDARHYEEAFGWRLPESLHRTPEGDGSLIEAARGVADRLRKEGFPGVYVATRGDPGLARSLL